MDTDNKAKDKGVAGKITAALKKNKKLEITVYCAIIVLILVIYASTFFAENKNASTLSENTGEAEIYEKLENRLEAVLTNIKGAGKVQVMITYETGPELIPAMNVDTNINRTETSGDGKESSTENRTETSKPATVNESGGTAPIVLMEKQPVVRGVIVVAEGAANISVRLDLERAVQTVLDVPIQNIEIFELESIKGE